MTDIVPSCTSDGPFPDPSDFDDGFLDYPPIFFHEDREEESEEPQCTCTASDCPCDGRKSYKMWSQ